MEGLLERKTLPSRVVVRRRLSRYSFIIWGAVLLCCTPASPLFAAVNVTYVQGNYAVPQSSPTSVTVAFKSAQSAGDLNVVVIGWNNTTASVNSVTDVNGNIYVRVVGPTIVSGALSQSIYVAKNIVGATNTVTVLFSSGAFAPDIRVLEYAGADVSNPVDVIAAATGSGGTSSSGAATTTNANDLIFGANIVTGLTSGPGTGFTSRILTSPDGDIAEDRVVTSVGSYSATAGATGKWIMQMVAIRTSSGVTGVAPAITSASSTTFTAGTAGSFTVTTTGTPTPSLSETGTLPSGITFHDNGNGTATLSGTASAAGTFPITITASNGIGSAATQSFTLTVNQAPTITSASGTTFIAGTSGTFTVTATGTPTPSLSESGALPSGVSFADNGNGTAALSGTPASGAAGTYPIAITASNSIGSPANQNFTLTVNPANQSAPIAFVQVNYATPQGSNTTVKATYTKAQAAGDLNVVVVGWNDSTARVSSVVDSAGNSYALAVGPTVQSSTATQAIYYAQNITAAAANGNTVTVTFNTGAVSPDVRIAEYSGIATTNAVDVVATAQGTSGTSNSGSATTTNSNDLLVGANLVQQSTTGPGAGYTSRVITIPDSDILEDSIVTVTGSYGATASLSSGAWIMQMVAFRGAGGGVIGTSPAITSASSTAFTAGTAGSFTVTTTGTPTPSLSETGTLPSGVTFHDNGNGTATLSGTASAAGTFPITITASNGIGSAATQSFTLTVNQAPTITSASGTTFIAGTSGTFTVTATGTPTPSLSESGALPSGVSFADNGNGTAALSGTPASGAAGTYPIAITASNSIGSPANQNFTLTVNPANQSAPIAFVQVNYATPQGSNTTVKATYTKAQAAGNLNVVVVGWNDSTARVSSVVDSAGNSYALAVGPTVQSGTATQAIYYAQNITSAAANSNTVTVTFNTGAVSPDVRIAEYSGIATTNAVDVVATAQGTSGTCNSGSATTTNSNDLLVGANLVQQSTTGPGAGYTSRVITIPDSDILEDSIVTVTGSYGATASLSSGAWIMQMVAFRGAGGGVIGTSPAITSASSTAFTAGTAGSFTVTTTGTPTSSLRETGALPSGITFHDNGNGTATLSGTASAAGTFPITITASNGIGSPATQNFTLIVGSSGTGFSVTPQSSVLTFTKTQQFTATSGGVTWSVDGVVGGSSTVGTITAAGLYTPPASVSTHTVTAATSASSASATVYVTNYPGTFTFHNDNSRTGQNSSETVLNLSNINETKFGKLFSYPLDGLAYASPLYVANVNIPGQGFHNVVYIATENDTVYAWDADGLNPNPLWKVSFLGPGVTTVPCGDTGECGDIPNQIGITGTPVIDPSTGTLYVVANTEEGTSYVQRLHALDITTGAEKFGGPVVIQATVSGSGDGSQGGQLTFDPLKENQRAALLLANGVVYIAWASHGDQAPWHGWVMGYNASTLQQTMAYCVSPDGYGGGIWMSNGGLATDSTGNLFFTTGNGDFSASSGGSDYGDSIVKINPSGSVVDYFTPYDQSYMESNDIDLASAGPVLLLDQPGPIPHLLIAAGKSGSIYVVNRDSMGQFNPNNNSQIVQTLQSILPNGSLDEGNFSAPAFFNGSVYFAAVNDNLKAFQLSNGTLSSSPSSQSAETYPNRGGSFAISANGTSYGILWAVQDNSPSNGVLTAYDASNLSNELYNSSQAGSRDTLGVATKFSIPLVANGKVFVVANGQIVAYGLLP